MNISIIVAISENNIIGNNGSIPWNIVNEQLLFKKITMGNILIFGRKTYESIGHSLPGRCNIIITRQKGYKAKGCIVANSFELALEISYRCCFYKKKYKKQDVFICGGAKIYELAIPLTNRIYLTTIHKNVDGDTYFPDFPFDKFKIVNSNFFSDTISYSLTIYDRTNKISTLSPQTWLLRYAL